jgi:hypothetical protein
MHNKIVCDRVFVLSLPKAGTYLMAALLERLGFTATGWHVRLHGYEDYGTVPLAAARQAPEKCRREQPLAATLAAIPAGAFAVGHLSHSPETATLLQPFRRILLLREPRAALMSRVRFQWASGRAAARAAPWRTAATPQAALLQFLHDEGPERLAHLRSLAPWKDDRDLFALRFEDMQDDTCAPARLTALCAWLGRSLPEPAASLLWRLRATETLTRWSGAAAAPELVWDTACAAWWQSVDGPELARMFGYA